MPFSLPPGPRPGWERKLEESEAEGSWMEEGAGPGLPGSLAAAVQASQQESREAQPTGDPTPGEGEATAAAVAGMMQVVAAGGLHRVEGRRSEGGAEAPQKLHDRGRGTGYEQVPGNAKGGQGLINSTQEGS